MTHICVVTADGGAYYALVSRLRSAGLPFLSLMPGDETGECGLVLTTHAEAGSFAERALALEDLDENLDVARGQILSRLSDGEKVLLVGIDPGRRIGAAAFLGEDRLALRTFNSRNGACVWVANLVRNVPARRSVVRIGDGDQALAAWLAGDLVGRLPQARVEIVDESGTSRNVGVKGLQKDQGSAAKIAFRRGTEFRTALLASKSR